MLEVFTTLPMEIQKPLEKYREWIFQNDTQASLGNSIRRKPNRFVDSDNPEGACSIGYLNAIDHSQHIGYPVDMHGIDLNYKVLQSDAGRVDPELFHLIRRNDLELDDELQFTLGAKFCALKAFYPVNGHIGWHTNWNAPGYNIIFTYSPSGRGYWRHIEPQTNDSIKPNPDGLVHLQDKPGWHCKVGYFGNKNELNRVLWHCAYTPEPRLTVSYVIFDRGIWENMVAEIKEA